MEPTWEIRGVVGLKVKDRAGSGAATLAPIWFSSYQPHRLLHVNAVDYGERREGIKLWFLLQVHNVRGNVD